MAERLASLAGARGALCVDANRPVNPLYVLKYGKYSSIQLLAWIYRDSRNRRLERKFTIWETYVAREKAGKVIYQRASTRARLLRALDSAGA